MGLEKFDDAIAEYLETKRKRTIDALKLAQLSDNEIDQHCADIEKEILGFVKCNEAYAQLLMDLEHIHSKTYNLYSLTEIAKKKNHDNPSYVIQSWLRDINTLQFLYLWEKDNNSYFIEETAKELIEKTKQPSFTMTAKLWIKNTRATGIRSKQGHGGGTLARQEIAIDFITWAFPEKRYELSKLIVNKIMQLKE